MTALLIDRKAAIARYAELAHRMPDARFPAKSTYVEHLEELKNEFDVFVLDGFGVLNVGEGAIPGAAERVAALQAAGKQVLVLTNGASFPVSVTRAKYQAWGFEFGRDHVVSSRDALADALGAQTGNKRWGFVATSRSQIDQLVSNAVLLGDNPDAYDSVDGFVFLSSMDWSAQRQTMLLTALRKTPRPLLVGNPDLVAPREQAMSIEPGFYSHALADKGVCNPLFYGKPFNDVFKLVAKQINNVEPHRIAMVGDTLHTDILGGAAFGWRTVLITDYGLMKGIDVEATIEELGVRPDFIARVT